MPYQPDWRRATIADMSKKDPHIVVIGGGTGSFTLLSELKAHSTNLTALVNMADDGGSTGVLRDEYGVLPPGDVRQCLVALSSSQRLRELFNYRFPADTTFAGHSFGNLFLSSVEMMTNDFAEAVSVASEVLQIKGKVIPITLDNRRLMLSMPDGQAIMGQFETEEFNAPSLKQAEIIFDEPAFLNPAARKAIVDADLIVIAPGNLYVSLIPTLIVKGLSEALQASSAPKAYICNLVNKPQHTIDYAVHDYAAELERFIGAKVLTHVLFNDDIPSDELLEAYALEGEFPVMVDIAALQNAHYKPVNGHFLSRGLQSRNANDTFIRRSLIRHDAAAVSRALMGLL